MDGELQPIEAFGPADFDAGSLAEEQRLSVADIEHFAVHGYVVKRGFFDDDSMARAVDAAWTYMPPEFDRHRPETWHGTVSDCRGTMNVHDRFGLVKFRCELHADRTLKSVSVRNRPLLAMAEQLLGPRRAALPRRSRGVYPIFPTREHAGVPVNAHLDVTGEPFKLTFGVLLSDVPKNGGGLSLWPGTHRLLHHACAGNGSTLRDINTRTLRRVFSTLNHFPPTVLTGLAGDVVIMHHRLMHSASLNTLPGHVRLALYFNVASTDPDFAVCPPAPEMWAGWDGMRSIGSDVVRQTERRPPGLVLFDGWAKDKKRVRLLPEGGAWGDFARTVALHELRAAQTGTPEAREVAEVRPAA